MSEDESRRQEELRERYRIEDRNRAHMIEDEQIARRQADAALKRELGRLREHDHIADRAEPRTSLDPDGLSRTPKITNEQRTQLLEERTQIVSDIRDLQYLPELSKLRWISELASFDPNSPLARAQLDQHRAKLEEIRNVTDEPKSPLSELFRPV
jgi:hypothetical protein